MTAVVCAGILAFAGGLIFLHAVGLANLQERCGLRLLEMAEARRKREAAGAAENDARCKVWMGRRTV
jgi:hypothetical protein